MSRASRKCAHPVGFVRTSLHKFEPGDLSATSVPGVLRGVGTSVGICERCGTMLWLDEFRPISVAEFRRFCEDTGRPCPI